MYYVFGNTLVGPMYATSLGNKQVGPTFACLGNSCEGTMYAFLEILRWILRSLSLEIIQSVSKFESLFMRPFFKSKLIEKVRYEYCQWCHLKYIPLASKVFASCDGIIFMGGAWI